jgi:hypothetical protein
MRILQKAGDDMTPWKRNWIIFAALFGAILTWWRLPDDTIIRDQMTTFVFAGLGGALFGWLVGRATEKNYRDD